LGIAMIGSATTQSRPAVAAQARRSLSRLHIPSDPRRVRGVRRALASTQTPERVVASFQSSI